MHFYLKHAVGNRERWKTDDTLSHASAVIIANEVAAIPGVTGLVVNPRIGSVTLTVADAAAKARTLAYFESLAVNPPILRPDRAVIAAEDLEAAKRCGEMALQPLRREDLPPGIVPRTIYEIERGFTTMPLLNVFSRLRDLLGGDFVIRRCRMPFLKRASGSLAGSPHGCPFCPDVRQPFVASRCRRCDFITLQRISML